MKKLIVILFACLFLFACFETTPTAETRQTAQTNQILDEINRQVGLPNLVNYQQKKLMKMVFELCDKEDLVCYAYIKSDYQGKLMFIGKCIGFGVPFSAQYTNPMKIVEADKMIGRDWSGVFPEVIPQADPNGLYMPTSSSATWLMMIDPETNEPRPVYLEPEIVVSPFKLH